MPARRQPFVFDPRMNPLDGCEQKILRLGSATDGIYSHDLIAVLGAVREGLLE